MTWPGWMPDVTAVMSALNSIEPILGTLKVSALVPKYFTWSRTLESCAVWYGSAATEKTPWLKLRVSLTAMSPGPNLFCHFW